MKLPAKDEMREDGFTMVEILVVIIIIGILAAVAIPIFLNQRKASHDSALTSDLRNVAMNYETWRATGGNDDKELRRISNDRANSAFFAHEDADYIRSTGTLDWNSKDDLPSVSMSRGNFITLNLPGRVNTEREEVEGQFCLVGSNKYSNYNYKPGTGNPANYDHQLYYDSAQGGISTIQDLAVGYSSSSPEGFACADFIEPYLAATSG